MLFSPLPSVTNCHTFSDPSPSSVTYFMDGPLSNVYHCLYIYVESETKTEIKTKIISKLKLTLKL